MRSKSKDRPKFKPLPKAEEDIWAHSHPAERSFGFKPMPHQEKNCYCQESDQVRQTGPIDFDPRSDVEEVYPDNNWDLDDASFRDTVFPPLTTPAEEATIKELYSTHPELKTRPKTEKATIDLTPLYMYTGVEQNNGDLFHEEEAWIQTYSGKRFNPLKPIPKAIVIQDIAHSLSMQCRFSGHVKKFYSVAQHCVLVSYICDSKDALWGLLHDVTEAYLVDVPRPLKRSPQFQAYRKMEDVMQAAICQRFDLENEEPASVHRADTLLLATEARDLMWPLRPDWTQPEEPLPFTINPLGPLSAKHLYLKRFFQLMKSPECFNRYLEWESQGRI